MIGMKKARKTPRLFQRLIGKALMRDLPRLLRDQAARVAIIYGHNLVSEPLSIQQLDELGWSGGEVVQDDARGVHRVPQK